MILEKTKPENAEIRTAQHVLSCDIKALELLSSNLDEQFVYAVELLTHLKGKVVVSGMGKSGHIAEKIAATFASTGTPAHYVHPGEASHGDLGMLARGDALMLFSNSGETIELRDIVTYGKYLRLPLITVVGRPKSSLGSASDVALILPQSEEGCPLGLAPTTSTLMMLALGDALAMALMDRRGFSPSDFHLRHPGGRLGGRFLTVSNTMHGPEALPLVSPEAPMSEAILTMTSCRFGCVGVVDDVGKLSGIITDGDLRRHMDPRLISRPASSVMTPHPKTVRPGALASEALAIMNDHQISCLFVTEDLVPKGIIHIHDILRAGVV